METQKKTAGSPAAIDTKKPQETYTVSHGAPELRTTEVVRYPRPVETDA